MNYIYISLTWKLIHFGMTLFDYWGFPGGSDGKESTCNAGDLGSTLALGRYTRGGHGNPLQYPICLTIIVIIHDQSDLYSYWPNYTEEWLNTFFSFSFYTIPCHLLEKEMATHSSILAWRIPWTEQTGGLQSIGSQRVGNAWVITLLTLSFMYLLYP